MSTGGDGTAVGDTVNILRAHDQRRLTKLFSVATSGVVMLREYDQAKWFAAERVPVDDIFSLHRLLVRLEGDCHACIIRGEAQLGTDLNRVQRKKASNDGVFAEVPRRWVMLDIDGIPLPAATSVLNNPCDAARTVLDLLASAAPELENVTAVVQFSSRAGLDELAAIETANGLSSRWAAVMRRGISAHVWFFLRTPRGEDELKRWARAVSDAGVKLDQATVRTVQPHYTAAPLFGAPLKDPLAGRRTLLVEGVEDTAELVIPAPAAVHTVNCTGSTAHTRRDFAGWLNDIGGDDGFRAPMLRAIGRFIATNWPTPDTTALKAALRERILTADPGGRPPATIREYSSDRHLDSLIAWVMQREGEKRAQQTAEQVAQSTAPTFPDRGVPLHVAQQQAREALKRFTQRLTGGERPDLLLRQTVGSGKSEAAIVASPMLIKAAAQAGRSETLYYLIPRHDLGAELRERFVRAHPGLGVAVWRGIDWSNSNDPADVMCLDPELPRAAMAANLSPSATCTACALKNDCAYWKQQKQKADIWLLAHNFAFQEKPAVLPEAGVAVIDEAFWSAGLEGTDPLHPIQLAVSALLDERTGGVTGADRQFLLHLRRKAAKGLERQDAGGLSQEAFKAVGFTAELADNWKNLEWAAKPKVKLRTGMDRGAVLELLRATAAQGFTRLRPMLAATVRDLLRGTDARSINAELRRGADLGRNQGAGDTVRFAWRKEFAAWIADAPKLFLDATTHPDLIRAWAPNVEVVDIEVQAPAQRVRQVIGREFGRSSFLQNENNVARLADVVVVDLAKASGEALVIAQKDVEARLQEELKRRFGGALPPRLSLAHYGAVTGLDCHRHVEWTLGVGRPTTSRNDGERLGELLTGRSVDVVSDGDGSRWPAITGGIRRADGSATPVRQPRHPDPIVEALRWSISEGNVIQGAIGRPRGVQRAPDRPLRITVMAELALPLTVEEVTTWGELLPDRLEVAAAEAALTGKALPLAPADLCVVRKDMWETKKAVERFYETSKTPRSLISDSYKGPGGFSALTPARYRKPGARRWSWALVPIKDGRPDRAALEDLIGKLASFEPRAKSGLEVLPEQTAVQTAQDDAPALPTTPLAPRKSPGTERSKSPLILFFRFPQAGNRMIVPLAALQRLPSASSSEANAQAAQCAQGAGR